MKNFMLIFTWALFGLATPFVSASNGTDVSDDPLLSFEYTVSGNTIPLTFPLSTRSSSEKFTEGDYRIVYQPTGEEFEVRVYTHELYENNYDGTWDKTVTRQIEFGVERFTSYNIDFQMVDFGQCRRDGRFFGTPTRTISMNKETITGGSTLNTGVSGDRDLQDAPFTLIIAYEMNLVMDYAFSSELVTKAREQATKQVLQNRDDCAGEVTYFLLKYLDYLGCDDQSSCLQDMLSMERVAVAPSCGGGFGAIEQR